MRLAANLTHVAVLTTDVARAAQRASRFGLKTNAFEEFEHEGTRECYVGAPDRSARLLLVEAIHDGPYRRALAKRGPGLHHLGVQTAGLEEYASQLAEAGWLLHSRSLETFRKSKTVYFARPGVPFLVEASENEAPLGPPSIETLSLIGADSRLASRVRALQICNVNVTASGSASETSPAATALTIEGRRLSLDVFLQERTIP